VKQQAKHRGAPSDDTLAERLLTANLALGRYDDAIKLIGTSAALGARPSRPP
jgi:hypothetical protein